LDKYLHEITSCNEVLKEVTGTAVSVKQSAVFSKPLFRPPYGRIKGAQLKALLPDYAVVMWDVLTGDYNQSLHLDRAFKRSCKETRPGSIVVFHDSYKAEKQLKSLLPRYIDYCLAQGYSFEWL
jgi:peptidoglycan/xylan/chitin deacetylase (PgdA/CDA1 family)